MCILLLTSNVALFTKHISQTEKKLKTIIRINFKLHFILLCFQTSSQRTMVQNEYALWSLGC